MKPPLRMRAFDTGLFFGLVAPVFVWFALVSFFILGLMVKEGALWKPSISWSEDIAVVFGGSLFALLVGSVPAFLAGVAYTWCFNSLKVDLNLSRWHRILFGGVCGLCACFPLFLWSPLFGLAGVVGGAFCALCVGERLLPSLLVQKPSVLDDE